MHFHTPVADMNMGQCSHGTCRRGLEEVARTIGVSAFYLHLEKRKEQHLALQRRSRVIGMCGYSHQARGGVCPLHSTGAGTTLCLGCLTPPICGVCSHVESPTPGPRVGSGLGSFHRLSSAPGLFQTSSAGWESDSIGRASVFSLVSERTLKSLHSINSVTL